eukprot:TRINITY_DN14297_c0_g1_i1.p1 TRINITY_DN14297_c0_g1~~TRINITY_DN14297_c0_g1_i1.p1  ORF type:complete len:575 (-),score=145.48 TRINITY_DN14297_c0_g1_i1:142-1767(-)
MAACNAAGDESPSVPQPQLAACAAFGGGLPALPTEGSADWPLSRDEKRTRIMRLYDHDVQAADELLLSGEAALQTLRAQLDALRLAVGLAPTEIPCGGEDDGSLIERPELRRRSASATIASGAFGFGGAAAETQRDAYRRRSASLCSLLPPTHRRSDAAVSEAAEPKTAARAAGGTEASPSEPKEERLAEGSTGSAEVQIIESGESEEEDDEPEEEEENEEEEERRGGEDEEEVDVEDSDDAHCAAAAVAPAGGRDEASPEVALAREAATERLRLAVEEATRTLQLLTQGTTPTSAEWDEDALKRPRARSEGAPLLTPAQPALVQRQRRRSRGEKRVSWAEPDVGAGPCVSKKKEANVSRRHDDEIDVSRAKGGTASSKKAREKERSATDSPKAVSSRDEATATSIDTSSAAAESNNADAGESGSTQPAAAVRSSFSAVGSALLGLWNSGMETVAGTQEQASTERQATPSLPGDAPSIPAAAFQRRATMAASLSASAPLASPRRASTVEQRRISSLDLGAAAGSATSQRRAALRARLHGFS